MGQLKKMLATLKPLARDAYKAAMATREGKDAAAARKVVRSLFEHIPRDAILDAYAKATNPQRVARGGHLDIPGALAAQKCEREWPEERSRVAGWCLD